MYGRTPLHIVVCEGHEDVVTWLLLEYKANSWRATKQVSLTPVHFATMLGRTRCLQLLLSCGARVNDPLPELKDLLPVNLVAMHGHDQGVAVIVEQDESMGLARGFFTFNIHTVRQPPRVLVLQFNQWIDGLDVRDAGGCRIRHHMLEAVISCAD
ncbi:hypothetical protein B0T24DRAFT_602208 [Lasiosphaeria ovina]|uniref:Ankyrin repeat protein n=1 Tax=Lasiosphaeria ovina TaxID=92902 RepID=A0AAE0NJN9_9PEZI|nr:hypothetical protein B0T24DRAFT_602208 [Lasiosphaeria ovina]